MKSFVETGTVLDRILATKVEEVKALYQRESLYEKRNEAIVTPPSTYAFADALRAGENVALIAEVKHASPSKGVLIDPFEPTELAQTYLQHGASALSVLTDERYFQGHLDHLKAIRPLAQCPILRKDFIIDELQIYEARCAGADAILLIVMALEEDVLAHLHQTAVSSGLSVLVEVHNEAEMERALKAGASIIGVNNRDLRTFKEDLTTLERIAKEVPSHITLVAESAIRSADDVARMGSLGAHAVLVGEGLVKAEDIGQQVRSFSSQKRGVIRK